MTLSGGLPASAGGVSASSGGATESEGRVFYDPFEPGMMGAYVERATSGGWNINRGAGYHTGYGLYLDGLNYLWTLPGSGFSDYPDTDEWVVYVFTIGGWSGDDQLRLVTFGDPGNQNNRAPAYEIQFNRSAETFKILVRDGSDNRQDVATDAESNGTFGSLSTGTAYAAGIYRKPGGGVLGGLWEASAAYPDSTVALSMIDSADHPDPNGSSVSGLGPDDGPGRWGVRTGQNMDMRLHEVERAMEGT